MNETRKKVYCVQNSRQNTKALEEAIVTAQQLEAREKRSKAAVIRLSIEAAKRNSEIKFAK